MKALILSIFLLIFTGFVMQNKQQYYPSRGEQLVNSILANTTKIIKDKYLLQPCGEGADYARRTYTRINTMF